MAETIESFVARLQRDGVETGRQEAERIVADARREAERTVADARREAERTVQEAARAADRERDRGRQELQLAARDVVLELQQALTVALRAALTRGVAARLDDADFLGPLLHEIVLAYAQADASRATSMEINLTDEMRSRLAAWALHEIREVRSRPGAEAEIDLRGALEHAGFEYKARGATIEVTVESVVERLLELVGPDLRDLIGPADERQS